MPTQIFKGSNLLGPDLSEPNLLGPNLPQKMSRDPFCHTNYFWDILSGPYFFRAYCWAESQNAILQNPISIWNILVRGFPYCQTEGRSRLGWYLTKITDDDQLLILFFPYRYFTSAWRKLWLALHMQYCGFWSNRTLLYFPLSSVRPPSVTGVTSQLSSIIWLFRLWKPYIFWMNII